MFDSFENMNQSPHLIASPSKFAGSIHGESSQYIGYQISNHQPVTDKKKISPMKQGMLK